MCGGEKLRRLLPEQMRRGLSVRDPRRSPRGSVAVLLPRGANQSPRRGVESKKVRSYGSGSHLWILVRRKDFDGWWPQGAGAAVVDETRWRVSVTYGGPQDAGREFEIAALVVGEATHELWTDWVARGCGDRSVTLRCGSHHAVCACIGDIGRLTKNARDKTA